MNWERVRLGEAFEFQKKSKTKAGEGLDKGEYPFYTSSEILSKFLNEYHYEGDALIFGTGGKASVHYNGDKFSVSTDCFVIKPQNDDVFVKYVYYYLSGNIYLLEEGFKGAGLKHISKEYLSQIEIPLPPMSVQKEIVEKLDKAAAIREKSKALLAHYDALAESLFIELFGDPISNEKGWEMDDFEKVLSLKRGYDLPIQNRKRDGEYPVYGSNGILDYHDSYKMQEPCIIMGRSGTIGLIHKSTKPCWPLNTSLYSYKINGNNIIFLEYLLRFFRVERFSHGAGVPTLDRNLVHKEKLPQIPLSLQIKFAEMVENIEEQKARAKAEIEQSEAVFQALLQESFG